MAKSYELQAGDQIELTTEEIDGDAKKVTISYKTLTQDLHEGDFIFVNDGIVRLKVTKVLTNSVMCKTIAGGVISEHKGVNIPTGNLQVEIPTPKDKEALRVIAELKPDYVAASFVGKAADVESVRRVLRNFGEKDAKIISKIERPVGLKNFDEILRVSDGIMVARGDLGVEIPPQEVPVAQKEMIRKSNKEGRPVIVATQMLESMVSQARPTRAEANDVFNAVLDGADAVMLSGETSVGKYPVEAITIMNEIATRAEKFIKNVPRDPHLLDSNNQTIVETAGHAVQTIAEEFARLDYDAKILCITNSGFTAQMISKYRPNFPILAITPDERVAHQLCLIWGVRPLFLKTIEGVAVEEKVLRTVMSAWEKGYIKETDKVITVSSSSILINLGTVVGIYLVKDFIPKQV
ncbi:MAG: pyruvate kinase [Promethearchaeota archaeon CR_4]|nr:MAG: pyruvate kinase [Candidatus Lokiarchaeota archaeon CR_4]